jgi:hypothetical protein
MIDKLRISSSLLMDIREFYAYVYMYVNVYMVTLVVSVCMEVPVTSSWNFLCYQIQFEH